jgi:enoyl-CoA hydratase/long-chain 3-hydroxyacyl-CoA dehydrogenase
MAAILNYPGRLTLANIIRWSSTTASGGVVARKHIQYEIKDNVAVIRLNQANSKVNTLSKELSDELIEVCHF